MEASKPSGGGYEDANHSHSEDGGRKNKRSRSAASEPPHQRHRSESGATEPSRATATEYSWFADMEPESGATEPFDTTAMKIGFRGLAYDKDLCTTPLGSWQRSDGTWARHEMIDINITSIAGIGVRISLPIKTSWIGDRNADRCNRPKYIPSPFSTILPNSPSPVTITRPRRSQG